MNIAFKINLTCLIIILLAALICKLDESTGYPKGFFAFVCVAFILASAAWVVSAFFVIWWM